MIKLNVKKLDRRHLLMSNLFDPHMHLVYEYNLNVFPLLFFSPIKIRRPLKQRTKTIQVMNMSDGIRNEESSGLLYQVMCHLFLLSVIEHIAVAERLY